MGFSPILFQAPGGFANSGGQGWLKYPQNRLKPSR
jgi:hypothetical protein